MERNRNIGPTHAIRLSDLCEWHVTMATCFLCRHQERLTVAALTWERSPHARLTELERKLRCTRCGNRELNTFSVRMAPRN